MKKTDKQPISGAVPEGQGLSARFVVITTLFVTCLLTSNIISVKLISLWGLVLPAGVIIFPLSYIVGDVLTEVYGFGRARQVIWLGFGCNLVAVLAISAAGALPAPAFWEAQPAYARILGYAPRLLAASFLAYLVGDMDTFNKVAETNLGLFKQAGVNEVLTTCAGCHKTFADIYPHEGHKDGYRAEHIVETMERLINEGKLKLKEKKARKVIYHDPCDLGRHLGVYEPPRNVISAIPGIELLEFAQNRALAKCCGGGGGVKAFDNELGGDIGFERVKQAIAAEADLLVSACPSCKNSLNQAAARARKEGLGKIKVMDITELVASHLAK